VAARARPVVRAGPRRVPAPLLAIMAVAVIAAVAWTCALPPWQGPDEDSHFAYVQKIAAAHTIPWHPGGAPADPGLPYSTELAYALTYGDVTPAWANPAARPGRTPADAAIWKRYDATLQAGAAADGGFTSTMQYPPLYYLYAALPYEATSGLGIYDRVFAVRLANIPALLAVVVFTWLLAGELFGRRRALQALAALAVALEPQLVHMTAVVNPDVFLAGIWAAALYVMVVLVKRGPTRARIAWTAALAIASCLSQPRGVAILIPAAAAVGLALWRHRRPARRWVRRALVAGAALVTLAGLAVLVDYALLGQLSGRHLRQLASYLWQFYLPKLGFMNPSPSHSFGVRQVFVERLFGGFANLEVNFSHGVYTALTVIGAVVLACALAGVVQHRADVRRRFDVVAVALLALVGYMAVLHAAAFRSLLKSPDPVITGRYLLPLLPLYGVMLALAVAWLPRRWGPVVAGVLVGGVVVLQIGAMGVLFARFYA
jgi:4-amino-4-deoxy-L-arabinose transferase-like glycosyltransferase